MCQTCEEHEVGRGTIRKMLGCAVLPAWDTVGHRAWSCKESQGKRDVSQPPLQNLRSKGAGAGLASLSASCTVPGVRGLPAAEQRHFLCPRRTGSQNERKTRVRRWDFLCFYVAALGTLCLESIHFFLLLPWSQRGMAMTHE